MKFSNLKVGQRIALGFSMVLGLTLLAMVLSIRQMSGSVDDLRTMLVVKKNAETTAEWRTLSDLNETRLIALGKAYGQGNAELRRYFTPLILSTSQEINQLNQELEVRVKSPEARELMGQVRSARAPWLKARDELFKAIEAGANEEALRLTESKLIPLTSAYHAAMQAFQQHEIEHAEHLAKAAQADVERGENILIALSVVCVIVGILNTGLLTRSITQPVHQALAFSKSIATGDLTHRIQIQRGDELGEMTDALTQMQGHLREIVTNINHASESIGTGTSEIAMGNHDLSQRTEQTAGRLQQTASSIEQISVNVKQTAESAQTANQLAGQAARSAERGGQAVEQVVRNMSEITASSHKIQDIIGVIDGIAFQTNILALNAAVEAARAGEQGRGFAVVATEVRNLAQRSAQAAKEIKTLISASVERVEAGSKVVQTAGEQMREIVHGIERVTNIMSEISSATHEQSSGIGLVSEAINELDRMTQQNAALVEQSAAAAQSMKEQAVQLTGLVGRFRLSGASA